MAKQDLVKNDDSIPTSTQVEAANSTTVYDSQNNPIKVSSFLSDQSNKTKILILVRHFYCGMCAAYLMAILDDPKLGNLMKSPDGDDQAEIIVVGPGNAANIEKYREFAGGIKCKVYTDPTKSLYKALNVTKRTLDLGSNPPQHLKDGFWNITLRSTKEMITAGPLRMFGGGDKKQLGAEFIFDSQGQCSFSHRMSNTRDHTEVADLANYAGYGEPEKKIEVPVGVQNLQNGEVKAESQAVAAAA